MPILLRLGFWQLDRADEKRQIQQHYAEQQSSPAVKLSQLDSTEGIEYRNVVVTGQFDVKKQILLDNQVYEKRVGYKVLTPLRIEESERYILVNRGWIEGNLRREKLPEFETPQDTVRLTGRLKHPSAPGLELSDKSFIKSGWPLVVQWVDIEELQQETGYDLYPYIMQLDNNQPYGFVRNWKIVSSSPEQSTSYAVQWFTLALALVLIFIFVNSRKVNHAKHESE